jgi:hypothetical protein
MDGNRGKNRGFAQMCLRRLVAAGLRSGKLSRLRKRRLCSRASAVPLPGADP